MSTGMEQLYQQLILDHAKHPAHRGAQEAYDVEVHHVNPTCGDEVTLRVRLDAGAAGGPVIGELTWTGQGCSISQASASVMSQAVAGGSVEHALALSDDFRELMDSRGVLPEKFEGDGLAEEMEDAVAFVGVARYPARIKCALLGWAAMKDAVAQAAATTTTGEDGR
ncbi:Fe-S cluster assembly sulfur transfer protein SufU [Cellulomonas pakistanensis]|uniref:Iron-sulfur cluster assembly scaffold protein NifU n=1 Tax=Cellulomonas pakistanensis TaxID=992287 RepID=A0A919P785_9CELL|nr:SUF system NifU family Fe-S cluster assembly protein [Cellulomonas pakistanensis]GIG35639.1 iron-sulfur cluster assembly scaffold protein NifU [Cellulomonas pakistanensis]